MQTLIALACLALACFGIAATIVACAIRRERDPDIAATLMWAMARRGLNSDVKAERLDVIIGSNGVGRTLVHVITGNNTRPAAGAVFVNKLTNLAGLDETAIERLDIGRKFQKPSMFDALRVRENPDLAIRNRRGYADMVRSRLSAWQSARVILLDEPLAGMTDHEADRTAADRAAEVARVRGDRHLARHGLGRRDCESRQPAARRQAALQRLDGKRARQSGSDSRLSGALSMLTISSLNQYYGSGHPLRDVSLNVAQRACSVESGRNGVGKATLFKYLVGLLPLKAGDITLDGRTITRIALHQHVAAGFGDVPRDRDIFPFPGVEKNLRIGAYAGERYASLLADFSRNIWAPVA